MSELTWHLQYAKEVLDQWFAKADRLFEYADLAVSVYPNRFNREGAAKYRATAIHAKTFGIVWHDRYKMLLDCRRNNF